MCRPHKEQAGTAWRKNDPWLRLYEAATEDNAKDAFLVDLNALARTELDARNNEDRPERFFAMVAKNLNNKKKTYNSRALPNLHSSFKDSISLPYSQTLPSKW